MTLLASEDEVVVGNAALCLGNCMEVPSAASSLLKTDIMRVLLKLAGGDSQETAVQLNAGIALGKLCTAEPRSVVTTEPGHPSGGHVSERVGQAKHCGRSPREVPADLCAGLSGSLHELCLWRKGLLVGGTTTSSLRKKMPMTGLGPMHMVTVLSSHPLSTNPILLSSFSHTSRPISFSLSIIELLVTLTKMSI